MLQENDTIVWNTLQSSCNLDPALAKRVYTQCVVEGYPMQLVRGSPLQMNANKFLIGVLLELDCRSKNNILVVWSDRSSELSQIDFAQLFVWLWIFH